MNLLTSLLILAIPALSFADDSKIVRVFLLAGQSNMEGQGVVEMNHEKYYNGGKGNLANSAKADPKRYAHLFDKNGEWMTRDDVFARMIIKSGLKKGGLSVGFTGYGGRSHIGPELQIGHRLGDHYEEPVLLIKTAWGGKSLGKDFRPPSMIGPGDKGGEYYQKMMAEYREGIAAIEEDFPALKGLRPVLSGFVWFQGWNDMGDPELSSTYEDNLVHLINDIRRDLEAPDLPVIVGELGNLGAAAGDKMKKIRAAQKAAVTRQEITGPPAIFVSTTAFARAKEESPNMGHGHHWFGNAESYFLIGDALGRALLERVK